MDIKHNKTRLTIKGNRNRSETAGYKEHKTNRILRQPWISNMVIKKIKRVHKNELNSSKTGQHGIPYICILSTIAHHHFILDDCIVLYKSCYMWQYYSYLDHISKYPIVYKNYDTWLQPLWFILWNLINFVNIYFIWIWLT